MSSRYSSERFFITRFERKRNRPDPTCDLAVQEHVVVDGHPGHEREILEDRVDSERAGVRHGLQLHLFAVDEDLPRVRLVEAGQDLHERRLARAVVADQSEHLARADMERDVLERRDDTEALADVLDPDGVGRRNGRPLGRRVALSLMSLPPSRPDWRMRSSVTLSDIDAMIATPRTKSNQYALMPWMVKPRFSTASDEHAERSADDGARSTEERGAADHGRRDGVEHERETALERPGSCRSAPTRECRRALPACCRARSCRP